jgi:hypothetical protein
MIDDPVVNKNKTDLPFWRWLPYVVFLGITVILAFPLLKNFSYWGIRDWDLFTTLHAAAAGAITDYGQFPFWNPYIGGGNILFAHPEVPVLNPLFLLLLALGPLAGLKIQVLVVYFLGMTGFYKLARHLGISAYAAFMPPIVYMLSSFLTLHFAAGHIPFHYFTVFPWLVLFYKKSLDKPIHILSAGAAVAFITLGSGAAVPLLFSLFFLFLISLLDMGRERSIRPPVYAIGAGICGLLFAAIKFFPMYDYLSQYPWIPEGTVQDTPLWVLPKMFFSFNQSVFADHIQGYVWGWHEYGAFIGPLAMLLILCGLIMRFRKTWPYLVLTVVSLIIALGSFAPPWSPWDLLHRLPGFESIRVPSRMILLAVFSFAVLAGYGVDAIREKIGGRRDIFAIGAAAVVLAIHLVVCLPILGETFTRAPEQTVRHDDFKQAAGDPNRMYAGYLSNRGTIRAAWLSAYRPGRGIIDYNNQVSEWYSENDMVYVRQRTFTPNRITFDLYTEQGGRLVVSQGYDTGWRRSDGKDVQEFADLVAIDVRPGTKSVEIYYYPRYFTFGLIVSVLSILGATGGAIMYTRLR